MLHLELRCAPSDVSVNGAKGEVVMIVEGIRSRGVSVSARFEVDRQHQLT